MEQENNNNTNTNNNMHQQKQKHNQDGDQSANRKRFKNDPDDQGNNNSIDNNSNNITPKDPRSVRRVYVANIPFDVKWSELKDLFREKVGNVIYCTIFENEEGKSRGCGLVEFSDQATARKAIDLLHRSEYKNRELVVKEDLDCERDRFGRIVGNQNNRSRDDSQRRDGNSGGSGGSGGGGGNNQRGRPMQPHNAPGDSYGYDHSVMSNAFGAQQLNTYGLSQQFLDSLGISLPLNNRIFVANLEYKVDQSKLEEIFKLAGRVAKVKLAHDTQGQSRGYGTVEYEHPVESVQAISMFNNQKLYGRTMSVRMDKYECEDDNEALPAKLPTGLESIGKGLGVGGQPLNINRSIMNATLIAPPHLTTVGQPMQQMHQPVQPAMQQALLTAQMQQMQQQQHQQHQQQQHQQQHPVTQAMQQGLPQTMQQQLQQSLQQPLQQPIQQQLQQQHLQQMAPQQPLQQTLGSMPGYSTLQQLSGAVRPPVSVYQQPQPQQAQQQQQQAQPQQQTPQQANPAPAANNLSVFSTFERQFREASAPQNFNRN